MNYNLSSRRVLLLASGVLLLTTMSVFADRKEHDKNPDEIAEHIVARMEKRLDLSDAQQESVQAIVSDFLNKRKIQHDVHKAKISALWTSPSLTADEVYAVMTERQTARTTQQRLRAEKLAALHAVLTPEQRQLAAKHWQRFMTQGHDGRHRKHGEHDKHRKWFGEE